MDAATADLRQLSANLAAASGGNFTATAAQLVRNAAVAVQQDAQSRAPRRTGTLASSIAIAFTGPLTAIIGPKVAYGAFQEFGTASRGEFHGSPYVILPKRGRYLVFEVKGQKVFAKKVVHPGIPHHPYMRPAVANQLQIMGEALGSQAATLVIAGSP